jgi:glycosyltransferase involved in cell wall biosynthesis
VLGIREKRVILYFGYIREYKGVKYLVQAMKAITQRLHVQCLICGEFYEGREEVFDLIKNSDLGQVIRVYDQFIPNESVHQYFCAADLIVLPYISATQSGVVQIAYHYDRPVLVTDVGGLPEVVTEGKTGYIVPSRNPEAILGAVLRYYGERDRIPFERYIQVEKQKYSWERMRDGIVQLSVKHTDYHLNQ